MHCMKKILLTYKSEFLLLKKEILMPGQHQLLIQRNGNRLPMVILYTQKHNGENP